MILPFAASNHRISGGNGSRYCADRRVFRRLTISARGHLAASGAVMGCRAARSSWRKEPPGQSSIPGAEPLGPPRGFLPPRPRFGRRAAMKILMGSDVVVPATEFGQLAAQIVAVGDGDAVEFLLERAEEQLDTSVLPRAVQFDSAGVGYRAMPVARIVRETKQ